MGIFKKLASYVNPASLIASGMDAVVGALGNAQQNTYNMQLAQYQNEYNTKMWHMQNEYNSPKATMERLVEAGINPRAYQQLGQFANASAPQPSAIMQKVSELSAFQSVTRQALENDLLRKQLEEKTSQINYREALNQLNNAKRRGTEHDTMVDALKAVLFMADNGIEFNNPFLQGQIFSTDGDGIEKHKAIQKVIRSFNQRYDAQLTSQKLLNDLRKFEALTKEDRYNMLRDYGLDTEGDSYLGLIRWFIRLLQK